LIAPALLLLCLVPSPFFASAPLLFELLGHDRTEGRDNDDHGKERDDKEIREIAGPDRPHPRHTGRSLGAAPLYSLRGIPACLIQGSLAVRFLIALNDLRLACLHTAVLLRALQGTSALRYLGAIAIAVLLQGSLRTAGIVIHLGPADIRAAPCLQAAGLIKALCLQAAGR